MASMDINLIEWMSQIPEKLWDTPLSKIAIPGSHDSFSNQLDPNSEIGPDAPPAIRLLGPVAKGILLKWSVTQTFNLKQQLMNGIRYFDFRVSSRNGTDQIHFIHNLYGTSVADGLDELIEFLDINKKEIVILDFNHFYGMGDDHHIKFLEMLLEKCGEKLCMFVGMESLTLNMLWENGLQIIIMYHNEIAKEMCQFWPGYTCKSHWAETTDMNNMFTFLDKVKHIENVNRFNVCQCVLTPNIGYILGNLNGSLLENIAKDVMPEAIRWVKQQRRGTSGVNIVTTDFIELGDFAKSVISLNFS
ncbi:PI-PLC X domain-containing protein 3-like [Ruditapes philippinarum]|uniref:PI-PLC X domain-containing protein 3-like n=1 Tax=Ruditapes philippinarum TaxID=129788 RepID=UPI00295B70C9|nr:PI-PLC X domain-containing protein 3-like [Ruditapes philippinarum]